MLRPTQLELIQYTFGLRRTKWLAAQEQGELLPEGSGLPVADPDETTQDRSWRHWVFLRHEIRRMAKKGHLSLAQSHDLLAEVQEREAALDHLTGAARRKRRASQPRDPRREPESPLETLWLDVPSNDRRPRESFRPPGEPRRSLLEMLLDPATSRCCWRSAGP